MRKPKPGELEHDPEPPACLMVALVCLWLFLAPLFWLVSLTLKR